MTTEPQPNSIIEGDCLREPVFPPVGVGARRELVLLLDAIEQLIWASRLHYERIQQSAIRDGALSDQRTAQGEGSEAARQGMRETGIAIVADVGALIGTIHRLRLLVNRLPGDPKTRLAKRAFEAEVKELEAARHELEHLDTAILGISQTGQGAFGTVSWLERLGGGLARCVSMFPGTLAKDAQGPAQALRRIRTRIDHVKARIAGADLNVTEAYIAVTRLEARLREWAESQAEQDWPALKENGTIRSHN